jgi:DNA-binding transcriptional regulator LsrR (DeoR family)
MSEALKETDLMCEVAKLYYIDEFIQIKIARKLNISRYKVNRILKKAKREGIVQIRIVKPSEN